MDNYDRRVKIGDETYKNIGSSYSMQQVDGSYVNYYQGQAISITSEATNAETTVMNNFNLYGALLGKDSPLSEGAKNKLLVDHLHNAQSNFISGALDLSSDMMQQGGGVLSIVGYGASATGVGASVGAPLVTFGNTMQYTGVAIQVGLDASRGNSYKATYTAGSNFAKFLVGEFGNLAPGKAGAIYNLTLAPFNAALDYGGKTIKTKNK